MRVPLAAASAAAALLLAADGRAGQTPATSIAATSVVRADSRLPAKDLRADAALLRRAYEALHPGLYRYNTPAQMDEAFRALEREFESDRTLAEAYLAFSVFAAKVKCGHTYPNFFNQSKDVDRALFRAGRVPFHFRWLGSRMIVTRSFTDDPWIAAGTEVLTINGVAVADILARLMTVARADGHNDGKRVAYLEVQGTSRLEAFDVYFPLIFPSAAPRFTLSVRGAGGEGPSELGVRPATYEERVAAMTSPAAGVDKARPIWEMRLLDGHVAYLRMPSWALYNSTWNWKAFLMESFGTLVDRGVTDLVIDLRGNEGGNDVGDVIVGHLITDPVPRQVVSRRVRYRRVPEDLLPHLDTWDPSFRDWGSAAMEPIDGFYRLRRDADDDPGGTIPPAAPRFAGRTWVLVGATNSSATFEFAQTLRQNRLGTLVGQPTGGNQRGINGGAFFFLRLPGSGIELDLPLIGQFPDGDRPDAGLQPDILVVPTAIDIARGRDAELEAALEAIRRTTPKARVP